MKTFLLTVLRMFSANKGRFFANFFIVLLSLALTSGLGSLPETYRNSFVKNYENAPDLILKCKKEEGFQKEDIESMKKEKDTVDIAPLFNMDYQEGESIYRFYFYDFDNSTLGKPVLIDGTLPSSIDVVNMEVDVAAEVGNLNRSSYSVSDKIELHDVSFGEMTMKKVTLNVTGNVNSPLYNSVQKENSMLDDNSYISAIFYINQKTIENLSIPFFGEEKKLNFSFPITDLYLKTTRLHPFFTKEYKREMNKKKEEILREYGEENIAVLTLEENVSYALFENYNEKVERIALAFPVFFITVCALVNLITITRLIKDERGMIGCYVSLGEPKGRIIFKYNLFSFVSVSLGGAAGIFIGTPLLPKVILPAYQAVFEISASPSVFSFLGIVSALLILLASLVVTSYSILSTLKDKPSELLKEKSPKPGKKIWMEKIPLLWNPLPFSFKSSFRNIFRQKKNLILTSLSILGATLLVLIGFALLDNSKALENDSLYANVASSMGTISFVIILFAVLMAVVVIYSLTNMNIQDREREIATLKVLGYHNRECSMYTFREIILISLVSSLLSLPLGALLISFVFRYLDFGSISNVKWYSYLLSYALINLSAVAVNFLLYPLIQRIDMNDSLKSVD